MLIPSESIEDEYTRKELERGRIEELFRFATASAEIATMIQNELTECPYAKKAHDTFWALYESYLAQIPSDAFNYVYPDGKKVYRHFMGSHFEYVYDGSKWRMGRVGG